MIMDLGPVGQRWMMHREVYYCMQESRSLVLSSTTAPIMLLKLNHQLIRGFADILVLELLRILLSRLGLHHRREMITMIIIVIIAIMDLGPLGQRWTIHRGSLLLQARVKKPGPFIYYCTNNAAEVESSID